MEPPKPEAPCWKKKEKKSEAGSGFLANVAGHFHQFWRASMDEHRICLKRTVQGVREYAKLRKQGKVGTVEYLPASMLEASLGPTARLLVHTRPFSYSSSSHAAACCSRDKCRPASLIPTTTEEIVEIPPVEVAMGSEEVNKVNMVEWFKRTVQSNHEEEGVDPLIEVKPSTRALKRALLIRLRCTDMDAQKHPKMGQIIHMLEGYEFPVHIEHQSARKGNFEFIQVCPGDTTG
ncbi:hypothetical protein ZIOFF_036568 [Zingiber officinale]|uniref:Uncharacterized protein n=1 Tax=Zingiber officinale TaxID=94328 RepID=A0A8J5L3J9_ZINOF|nr:hypothetical protein ZIOFF_036568 [Zingiber officinale]